MAAIRAYDRHLVRLGVDSHHRGSVYGHFWCGMTFEQEDPPKSFGLFFGVTPLTSISTPALHHTVNRGEFGVKVRLYVELLF